MNSVSIVGRLTKDPELRYTNNGTAQCRLIVAVDRGLSKDKREEAENKGYATADFISCIAWSNTAEMIVRYFSKGKQIALNGRIQTGFYDDKEGRRVYTTDVIIERVTFIGSRDDNTGKKSRPSGYQGLDDESIPNYDDDIPF